MTPLERLVRLWLDTQEELINIFLGIEDLPEDL